MTLAFALIGTPLVRRMGAIASAAIASAAIIRAAARIPACDAGALAAFRTLDYPGHEALYDTGLRVPGPAELAVI